MAGIPSKNMRLIVGHNEFSGLLSQMDFEAAVTEVDDSVAQTDDMEYLPGQISRTATASGRWTADVGGIDQYVGANSGNKSFVALSENGINYKVGTATKTSHTQTQSLGSRTNVSFGTRWAETDYERATEYFRQSFDTSAATTTQTGVAFDLGAAQSSAPHTIYLYYFNISGSVGQTQVQVQHSTTGTGSWTNADTHTFSAANINTATTNRRPAMDTGSYALNRYVRVRVILSGTNRECDIVVLHS